MAPKYFTAALLGVIALMILLAVAVVPASAVGQCGEGDCGKYVLSDCAASERCVEKWGGYYCVTDPTCPQPSPTPSPTPSKCTDGTLGNQCSSNKPYFCGLDGKLREYSQNCGCPEGQEPAGLSGSGCVAKSTSSSSSSCSSAGGTCRYYTGFYCYSGETDIGKKDCGYLQTCCYKAATAPKTTPTKTPAPETSSSSSVGQCGAKSCGKVWTAECLSTQRCVDQGWRGYNCVDDAGCGAAVPTKTPSTSTSSGSSCSSAGGICRYYTLFYCYPDESNAGRKDCGYLQTCCTPGAAITPPAKGGGKCNNNGVCETGAGGESYLNCPADCPKPMSYSNNKAQPNNKTCEDGTPVNACSTTKPRFCSATGRLIDNPSKCGAAATATPKVTDTCKAAGGTCKFAKDRPSDEWLGLKDCGWFKDCYKPNAAAEQARIANLRAVCGKKGCGTSSKQQDCLQTQKCVENVMGMGLATGNQMGVIGYLNGVPLALTNEGPGCVYDEECAELNAAN